MKVETIADLIDWNRAVHQRLAECLQHCASQADKTLAQYLLTYLADHEATLERIVRGFEEQADPKVLRTWVYDYLGGHEPIDPHRTCDAPFADMSFDEICRAVFDLHNQVLRLYRYLAGRAETGAARELINNLLAMEEHETLRLAQQSNRIRDM